MADSELDRLLAQYAQPPPPTLTGGAPPLPSINLTQQEPPLAQHNLVHRGLSSFGQPALDATEGALRGEVSPRDLAWTYLTEGPLGPFGMARGPTRIPDPIRAYHGSPHTFDEFRMDRIGTGEGAQAYGHGLYFAEHEGVARGYRDRLQPTLPFQALRDIANSDVRSTANHLLETHGASHAEARLRAMAAKYPDHSRDLTEAADIIRRESIAPGSMYEVNLHARPEQFLDWDAPLAQQSAPVVSGLRDAYRRSFGVSDRYLDHEWLPNRSIQDAVGAGRFSESMTDSLREAGIPGIRYLDQGSRGAGEGTRNFVVFNPEIIEILRRYGMAGPVAGGVLGGALGGTDGQQ